MIPTQLDYYICLLYGVALLSDYMFRPLLNYAIIRSWILYRGNYTIQYISYMILLLELLEYKRNWIQRVNRMSRNRLPRVMKQYSVTGRKNYGRPLKRLLGTWDRKRWTSGPTAWQIYVDDDDDIIYCIVSSIKNSRLDDGLIE